MNYLETVAFIRGIASDINPNGTFTHGRRVDGSGQYDGSFPQILLEPFITSKDLVKGIATANISLGFMFQDDATNTPEQREVIIGLADALCTTFEARLYNSQVDTGIVRETPFYMIFSGTVSGYLLSFTITSKISAC
jgi:hypothetical protein